MLIYMVINLLRASIGERIGFRTMLIESNLSLSLKGFRTMLI